MPAEHLFQFEWIPRPNLEVWKRFVDRLLSDSPDRSETHVQSKGDVKLLREVEEEQEVQYVMEQEGKHNIFARPASQGARRVRIGIGGKGKGQQDNIVMMDAVPNSHNSSIDDGFNSYDQNSAQKFDLSSQTVRDTSRVGSGNETIRNLTSMVQTVRAV